MEEKQSYKILNSRGSEYSVSACSAIFKLVGERVLANEPASYKPEANIWRVTCPNTKCEIKALIEASDTNNARREIRDDMCPIPLRLSDVGPYVRVQLPKAGRE